MEIFLAYICLKVFETGSLCCFISSFYSIFLFKSVLKSITLRRKRGGALFGRGALFRENTVISLKRKKRENGKLNKKYGSFTEMVSSGAF